jgi:hypothetical protein
MLIGRGLPALRISRSGRIERRTMPSRPALFPASPFAALLTMLAATDADIVRSVYQLFGRCAEGWEGALDEHV